MSEPHIRRAVKGDIPAIVRFNQAMALETENIFLDTATLTTGVESVFDDSQKGFYIVAEVDSEARACLMITYEWSDWRNGLFWWIQSVYVDKNNRKEGLYKLMYKFIKTLLASEDKVIGIRLYVDGDNLNAQEVYKHLGMKRTNYELFEYIQTPPC